MCALLRQTTNSRILICRTRVSCMQISSTRVEALDDDSEHDYSLNPKNRSPTQGSLKTVIAGREVFRLEDKLRKGPC